MSKRILLVEPYDMVAGTIVDILEQLDYEADVVMSGHLREKDLNAADYHCVLINLDQNRSEWRDHGLRLAEVASKAGLPVVLIPDHQTAAIIEANGWLQLPKPFTLHGMKEVLGRARQ